MNQPALRPPAMTLTFEVAGTQINGDRDYQEDAFLITRLADGSGGNEGTLIIVADGMGGHAAGNVASNMAVQTFNKHVTSHYPTDRLPEVLRESVLQANNSIRETVRETAALKGMGCTLVACVVQDNKLYWVSVGDSHLYLLRGKEMKKKNADHSYGGFLDKMAQAGKQVEAEAGFSRNMLMSALTGEEIADIDCPDTPTELMAGDRIIVCTDGLDAVSHGMVVQYAESTRTPKECVDALLKAVTDAAMPRQDNTTVVVVDVVARAQRTAAPLPSPAPVAAAGHLSEAISLEGRGPRPVPPPPPRPRTDTTAVRRRKARSAAAPMLSVLVLALAAAGAGYWYWYGAREAAPVTATGSDSSLAESAAPAPAAEIPAAAEEAATADTTPAEAADAAATADAEPAAADTAPIAAAPETFADPLKGGGTAPRMVRVPGGSFEMGSPSSSLELDERPRHTVTLEPFSISQYEVTHADYARFARATGRQVPRAPPGDPASMPVTHVSWDDAVYYTRWLSQQTGKTYRLPSEAEWEYAASGGAATTYWWGATPGKGNAHCFGCESGFDTRQPAPVGSFKPNGFGLYDTAGNVQEWVRDCYNPNYEGAPADGSVFEGGDCSLRVVRGGSFSSTPKSLRTAKRDKMRADKRSDEVGIRVLREED